MSVWEDILEKIVKLEEQHKDVFAKIEAAKDANKQSFNFIDDLPNYHEAINSIRARVITSIALFKSLESANGGLSLVPMSYLNGLSVSLSGMLEMLNNIIGAFASLEANGGIGTINPSSADVMSVNQAFPFNFANPLTTLDGHLDNALDSFYKINFIFQHSDFANFSNITETFSDVLDEFTTHKNTVAKLLEESKALKKKIDGVVENVNTELTGAQGLHKQISDLKLNADTGLKDITDAQTLATQRMPTIEDVFNKATTLKAEVEAYQPQFEQFKAQLDQRTKKYTDGNTSLDALIKSLKEQETEVIRINSEATAALNFATVAGLAKGFEDRRKGLDDELKKSHTGYIIAVVSLFLSTLFPAVYIAGNVFGYWPDKEIKHEQLLVLLLLIVPSAIMTRFTSSRYNSLFRLREQYAHKFSVAFSMEGFKGQLDDKAQQSQLVATTFAQLSSNNPADTIEHRSSSEDHPLPIWNKFLDLVFPKK